MMRGRAQIADGRYGGMLADRAVLLGFLSLVSALWVESDLYRYAVLGLVLWGLVIYFGLEKGFRPSIGGMGFACIVWTLYVGIRFVWSTATMPLTSEGSAEGIYLLPILYMTTGYVFFLYRLNIRRFLFVVALFSLLMLAMTIEFPQIAASLRGGADFLGDRFPFLVQNNLIHASVAAGLIAVAMTMLAMDLMAHRDERTPYWRLAVGVCVLVILLCLIGIFGAKSRGVWLALFFSMPLTLLAPFSALPARTRLAIAVASFVVALMVIVVLRHPILAAIDPIEESAVKLYHVLTSKGFAQQVIENAVANAQATDSLAQRLLLWVKALGIWSDNWVMGVGIYWRTLWLSPDAIKAPFDLFHNGFLEVGVRYGMVGLLFYGGLFAWCLRQSLLCARQRLIARGLFGFHAISLVFFLLTLLSNSNNRLAIGESYALVFAAFGFCCFYLRQWDDWRKAASAAADPRTALWLGPPREG